MEKSETKRPMINKYINSIFPQNIPITNAKIKEFCDEQKIFPETGTGVLLYIFIIRNDNEEAKAKAEQIRREIHNADDFTYFC